MPSRSDPGDPGLNPVPEPDLRRAALNRVGTGRWAPADLLKELARHTHLGREQARALLRGLVAAGELAYVSEHGRTVIEPSFDRPVRVSDRIVLTPPGRSFAAGATDAVIRIAPGAAFGAGRHPSTRLALRGIDFRLGCSGGPPARPDSRVLDIGTGSGALVMAAVQLGIASGLALDIDPCAVAEARANVEINGLSGRIVVSDRNAETVDGAYDLVTANLRPPTLARLAPRLGGWTAPGGALVIAGMRSAECDALLGAFDPPEFHVRWRAEEQGWVGLVLVKPV
jgi:ribosomal protein L11 methyltransferase